MRLARKCHFAECHYAECRYAECRCTECLTPIVIVLSVVVLFLSSCWVKNSAKLQPCFNSYLDRPSRGAAAFSIMTLSIMTLSIMILSTMTLYAYAECHYGECLLCWVWKISPLCWVSLCWVSLCWVSLCGASLCWMSWRPFREAWHLPRYWTFQCALEIPRFVIQR